MLAGLDAGARHWAVASTLIATAKLNGVEPLAYLASVLRQVVSGRTRAHEIRRRLPWIWRPDGADAPVMAATA